MIVLMILYNKDLYEMVVNNSSEFGRLPNWSIISRFVEKSRIKVKSK